MISTEERNALVEKWKELVWKVAIQVYAGRPAARRLGTLDDVAQIGQLGLIRAAELYDPNNPAGATFKTYAHAAIHNTIMDRAREAGIIRIPNWAATSLRQQNLGVSIIPANTVKTLRAASKAWHVERLPARFDQAMPEDDGPDAEQIQASLRVLNKRDRWIVERYFGFGTERKLTFLEIGNELGVTRERARQLLERALSRLRPLLEVA